MKVKIGDIVTATHVNFIKKEYQPDIYPRGRVENCKVIKLYEHSALLDISDTDIYEFWKNQLHNKIVVGFKYLVHNNEKEPVIDKHKLSRREIYEHVLYDLQTTNDTLSLIAVRYGITQNTVRNIKKRWKNGDKTDEHSKG